MPRILPGCSRKGGAVTDRSVVAVEAHGSGVHRKCLGCGAWFELAPGSGGIPAHDACAFKPGMPLEEAPPAPLAHVPKKATSQLPRSQPRQPAKKRTGQPAKAKAQSRSAGRLPATIADPMVAFLARVSQPTTAAVARQFYALKTSQWMTAERRLFDRAYVVATDRRRVQPVWWEAFCTIRRLSHLAKPPRAKPSRQEPTAAPGLGYAKPSWPRNANTSVWIVRGGLPTLGKR